MVNRWQIEIGPRREPQSAPLPAEPIEHRGELARASDHVFIVRTGVRRSRFDRAASAGSRVATTGSAGAG